MASWATRFRNHARSVGGFRHEVETKKEAWAEYLNWEASIPPELVKPFRPVKTAFTELS